MDDRTSEEIFTLSNSEKEAIEIVLTLSQQWGYGNMIAHIKRAWAEYLIAAWNTPPDVALRAANVPAYPLRSPTEMDAGDK